MLTAPPNQATATTSLTHHTRVFPSPLATKRPLNVLCTSLKPTSYKPKSHLLPIPTPPPANRKPIFLNPKTSFYQPKHMPSTNSNQTLLPATPKPTSSLLPNLSTTATNPKPSFYQPENSPLHNAEPTFCQPQDQLLPNLKPTLQPNPTATCSQPKTRLLQTQNLRQPKAHRRRG